MGAFPRSLYPLACAALLACAAAPPVIAGEDEGGEHFATTLQLYGSWTPAVGGSIGQPNASWGLGAALQWSLATQWQIGLDAARFESDRTIVAPFVVGATYAPRKSKGVHPYAEAGGGYYRLTRQVQDIVAFGSSGTTRAEFTGERAQTFSHDAVGAYFGAGLAVGLSPRLGFDAGARAHNWVDIDTSHRQWDGMLSFRSGLSYRF